jgi:hypothetical protein
MQALPFIVPLTRMFLSLSCFFQLLDQRLSLRNGLETCYRKGLC